MAHWFGIMPWHIDPDPPVLTFAEIVAFTDWLQDKTEDG